MHVLGSGTEIIMTFIKKAKKKEKIPGKLNDPIIKSHEISLLCWNFW